MVSRQNSRKSSAIQTSHQKRSGHGGRPPVRRSTSKNLPQHSAAGAAHGPQVSTYAIIIEQGRRNYSAYVPDLPGCVAAAKSKDDLMRLIREAIEFHIEGLRLAGEPVPPPSSTAENVAVTIAL